MSDEQSIIGPDRGLSPAERELCDKGAATWDAIHAIIDAHIPPDLREHLDELLRVVESLGFEYCFVVENMLYRDLIRRLPHHVAAIRDAYQATVFSGCQEDWEPIERDPVADAATGLRLIKRAFEGEQSALE
jgi:hypothetical protein